MLVAKYLLDGDAWFSIGAEKWMLFDRSLTLKHGEACGGFLCDLSLYRGRSESPWSRLPVPVVCAALLGASAGLFGCLVFFLFVSGYDLDLGFLRRLVVAGIP